MTNHSDGEGHGPSTFAADRLASPSASGRGQPSPDLTTEEELACAIYEADEVFMHEDGGEYVDGFQVTPGGYVSWSQLREMTVAGCIPYLKAARAVLALIRSRMPEGESATIKTLNAECEASMETIANERARAEAAESEVQRMREALEPIVHGIKKEIDDVRFGDDHTVMLALNGSWVYDKSECTMTLGDFRRAAAALYPREPEHEAHSSAMGKE